MRNGQCSFRESMALAGDCLRTGVAQAFGSVDDPLQLNLPPLPAAAGQAPDAATLRTMATLYLQSELEQAGVIAVAELLAESRRKMELRSARAIRKLDEFAERGRHQWYDRQRRNVTFARLFGLGMAASLREGNSINHDFQQRLASLCFALVADQKDYFWGQRPGPSREAALRETARSLLFNLGPRQYGNLDSTARLIQAQLQAAVDLLNDPDLAAYFRVRGMWEVLRLVLGSGAPDLGRLVTRGQMGLRLLDWLASVIPTLSEPVPVRPLLPADSPVYTWAAAWLTASGIEASALNPVNPRR